VNFMRAEHWECEFMRLCFVNVNFIRAKLYECEFICEVSIVNVYFMNWALRVNFVWAGHVNLWELSFVTFKNMRAEHCECKFYESWASWKWILWELRFMNVSFMSWAFQMWILWDMSIVNMNFMSWGLRMWIYIRAELCECGFYESWAGDGECRFFRKLSIVNVNFMRAEHCECDYYDSWAFWMWIYESVALQMWILMRAEICACEFYEFSWALRMWISWELSARCECEFMRAELRFVHVYFMRTKLC